MNPLSMISQLDPRTTISDFVQGAVAGITGSEELGSLAGLVTDLKTGNYFGALTRGTDMVQSTVQDFQVEAELRWGPGAHNTICASPANVACCCPGPSSGLSVEISSGFGLFGWTVNVSVESRIGSAEGASPGMRSVLDDPSLSLEAKVALLFSEVIDGLDDQIDGKLRDMEAAQRAQDQDKAAGGDGESAGNDFNRISVEVQMLMQKRGQMYGLQSNMMSMFNDVSMQIVNNVR